MSLRKKTLTLIGLVLFGLIGILALVERAVLLHGFRQVETQVSVRNNDRVHAWLTEMTERLGSTTEDWSYWDDTHNFVRGKNPAFITNNFEDASISTLGINLALLYNAQGKLIWGTGFDTVHARKTAIPAGAREWFAPQRLHLANIRLLHGGGGLILLPEGPFLVAVRGVLPNDRKGKPSGTLVFGKALDEHAVRRLSSLTRTTTTLEPLDRSSALLRDSSLRRELLTQPTVVRPLDAHHVAAYSIERDLLRNPILLLQVVLPRETYRQGLVSLQHVLGITLGVGLILGATTLFLMERSVLARL